MSNTKKNSASFNIEMEEIIFNEAIIEKQVLKNQRLENEVSLAMFVFGSQKKSGIA